VPRDAFHVRAVLLVKFPPCPLAAPRARDRHEQIICLHLFEKLSYVPDRQRPIRCRGEVLLDRSLQRLNETLLPHTEIGRVFRAALKDRRHIRVSRFQQIFYFARA
jgi:hypothetical protein